MISRSRIFITAIFTVLFFTSHSWSDARGIHPQALKLVQAAVRQIGITLSYNPAYVKLKFPGGDVPISTGVCSDVIIRAFRAVGLDLQLEVNKDMRQNFSAYPSKREWGLSRPDPNIDHRRVLNLMTYFKRKSTSFPVSSSAENYHPGDVVAWLLTSGVYHIGLISDQKVPGTNRYFVVHNIGAGTVLEDILFQYTILGHYRHFDTELK